MGRFAAKIGAATIAFGAPGLLLVAFFDSSFLSLPEVADLLVVFMVTQHKGRALLYAGSATLGSLAGCLVMYYIGRKGGEALVRKRFTSGTAEKAMATIRRYGLWAVLVPAVLPPPAPFKIFVILAGVAGIPAGSFIAAVLIGRGGRYVLLALLAVEYGDRAMAFLEEHGVALTIGIFAAVLVAFLVYLLWRRRPAGRAAAEGDER